MTQEIQSASSDNGAVPAQSDPTPATPASPSLPSFTNLGPSDTTTPVTVAGAAKSVPIPDNTPIHRVKLALSLGGVLVELRGRVLEAQLRGPEIMVNPTNPSDGYWLASTWRGLFSRAYDLHRSLLGDAPVDLARYNLTEGKPLYLSDKFDFINIGLESTNIQFGLAEKLRQALNFLTCLYQRLDRVNSVLSAVFEGDNPSLVIPTDVPSAPDQYNYLINDLTTLVDALITAWDNYVRERLFAESSTMLSARYGYAAGRALADISWNLTVKTAALRRPNVKEHYPNQADLDNLVYGYWIEQFKPDQVSYLQRQLVVLASVLNDDYVLQHPTATLQADATNPDPHEILDLKSPKAAINSVIQSLDYWQKTILEMSERGIMQRTNQPTLGVSTTLTKQPPSWSEKLKLHPTWNFDYLMDLRQALNEQQGNWFSLVAGREDLTDFRVVNVAGDLIQDYSREITHLATTNLQEAFQQIEREFNTLTELGKDSVKGIADVGRQALGGIFRNRTLIVMAGVIAVLILIVTVGLVVVGALNGPGLIASLATPLLGLLGIQPGLNRAVRDGTNQISDTEAAKKTTIETTSANSQRNMAQSASISAMVLTAAGEVREYLEKAFTNGYLQLQRELGIISATLAATSPLIEFVVRNCDPNNDLEFLSKIAWNDEVKRSQRDRIVIAAFGPVGAFLVASDTSQDALANVPQQEQQKAAQAQAAATDPALTTAR